MIKYIIYTQNRCGYCESAKKLLTDAGETFEEIQKTVDFAMNSGADSFSFAILSPLPGTPIYRKVIKENL